MKNMIKSLLIGFILICNATFYLNAQTYLLVFNASGPGSPPSNSGYYTKGTVVTATAIPYGGSSFIGWTGSITSSSNPVNITVNSNMTVTANFGPLPKLTIISNPSGAGSFSPSSGSTYVGGTSINITATPNAGYRFVSWSGYATGTNNPINITTGLSDMTLTANFEAIPIEWQQNGTKLFFNVDNVGIGTDNPETPLHVYGKTNNWKATFQGPDGYIKIGPANSSCAHIYTDRPSFIFNVPIYSHTGAFSAYSTSNLSLQTQGTTRMTILSSNGNVGIGITPNSEKLEVAGNVKATKFIGDGSGLTGTTQWKTIPNGIYFGDGYSGYVGIGEVSPTVNLDIKSYYDVPPVIRLNYSDGTQFKWDIENDGTLNFKYGTSNTSTKVIFGVNGEVKATKFTGDGSGLTGIAGLSQWTTSGSNISYTSGNVLIGKTTQTNTDYKLDVEGSAAFNGNLSAVGTTNLGGDLVLDGANNWILHTPERGDRTSLYIAPKGGENWDWSKQTRFDNNGNVVFSGNIGIGIEPQTKLHVNGDLRVDGAIFHRGVLKSQEINIEIPNSGWKDYVFNNSYKLMTLSEVEEYIKNNGHLPEIPSASDVEKDGINIGDMQAKLLQKIEELTLYVIKQEKKNAALQQKVEELEKQISSISK